MGEAKLGEDLFGKRRKKEHVISLLLAFSLSFATTAVGLQLSEASIKLEGAMVVV